MMVDLEDDDSWEHDTVMEIDAVDGDTQSLSLGCSPSLSLNFAVVLHSYQQY